MFDIGWSELLVIAVVAIVVVGPKDLPRLMRTFGHYMRKVRGMAADFQRQFEEAVRDSELDEVRKAMQEVRATASSATAAIDKQLMTPQPKPAGSPSVSPPASTETVAETASKPRAKRTAAKAKTAKPKTVSKTAARKTTGAKNAVLKSAPKPGKPRKPKEPAS
jgi:sec-independent protein translocase protein TatB